MSAYNPPKNQPPIFDTSQFQTSEKLDFPIAQGTETFYDIIINGTIIIPATPIAYLNNNQTFTGLNTFSALLTASNGFTLSSGTLTLPANSVSDSALSTNVPLLNANNNFTGATNTFNTITQNSNSNLNQSGTGIISQTGTGSNLLKDIAMNNNSSITLSGSGIINQTGSTGQNIFHTMRFNNSTINKQITLFESSTTNLASNFTISIESSTQRYNVNTGSSHIFSFGTGVSTYTNLATIDTNGLTMNSNKNIVLSGSSIINQSGGTGQNIFHTMRFNNSTINKQITLFENSPTSVAGNYTLSIEANTLRYNVPTTASHIISIGTGVSTYTNLATIDTNGLTMNSNKNIVLSGTSILSQSGTGDNILKAITMVVDTNLSQSGTGIISQAGTGTNQLKSTTISGTLTLSAGGTLVLPAGSIADSALSSNVPLKNANNTFTNTNNFTSVNMSGLLTLTDSTFSSRLYEATNGLYITNLNNSGPIYIKTRDSGGVDIDTMTLNSTGVTIIGDINLSSTGKINQTGTGNNNFGTTGTNSFSGDILVRSGKNINIYNSTNLGFTSIQQSGISTLTFSSTSTPNQYRFICNDAFGTPYTYIFSGTQITSPLPLELNTSSELILKDSATPTEPTRISQTGGNNLIYNSKKSGSILLRTNDATTNTRDMTISYTGVGITPLLTCSNGATISGTLTLSAGGTLVLPANSIADSALSTNVPLLNASNNFIGATNTFNAITLNTNQHLTLQGSGRITQASSSSKNTLNPSEFLGEITFGPSATARINQTSNGNGALLRQLNMLGNYDIVFDSGTGKINQTNSTGINTMTAITMVVDTNLSQSGTGIISQSGTGSNTLKAISMVANTNLSQSGTGIISQAGTGTNSLKNTTISGTLTLSAGGTLVLPAGSIADSALSSNVPLLNANNVFTGSINEFSTGSVELTNDSLYIRNGNGLNLFDTLTPASQSTIFVTDGNLNFENYGDMLSGSGAEGNIKFSTYNNTATFPRFKQRLNLNYDGVQVKNGVLRIYNTDETSYLQAQCDLSNSIITNYGNGGNLILRTWNGTSTKEMVQISYTQTTFTTEIKCQANINLQSTFTTPTSGQLGYNVQGVNYGLAVNPLVVGTTYLKGELQNLPVGVWLIESQACFKALGAFNYTYELCIISGGGLVITFDNYKTGYFQAAATNDIFGDKVSKVIVNTAVTSYRQLFRITRQTGNASFSPLDGNTYIQATRIA